MKNAVSLEARSRKGLINPGPRVTKNDWSIEDMNSEVEMNSQLIERVLKDRFENLKRETRIEVQEQNCSTTGRVSEGTGLLY